MEKLTDVKIHVHNKSWRTFFMELTLASVPLILGGVLIQKVLAKMDPTQEQNDRKKSESDKAKAQLNAKLIKNGRSAIFDTDKYEDMIMTDIFFPDQINVSFEDIGGLDALKERIYESVILPLMTPELFSSTRFDASASSLLTLPKGILFYGPPGTGKTMMAKAIAKECDATFINIKLSTLQDKWFGESQKLVRAVFSLARKFAPSIVFIDEIDMFLKSRDDGGGHEASASMKAEFISLWDGLTTGDEQVCVLGATNRPYDIDVAVLRRLPRTFLFDLPIPAERKAILDVILANQKTAPDFDLDKLANQTEGYSGSDLKELCKYACMIPVRNLIRSVRAADIAKYGPNVKTVIPDDVQPELLSNKHMECSLPHVQATGKASYQYQRRFEENKFSSPSEAPSFNMPSAAQLEQVMAAYMAAVKLQQQNSRTPDMKDPNVD